VIAPFCLVVVLLLVEGYCTLGGSASNVASEREGILLGLIVVVCVCVRVCACAWYIFNNEVQHPQHYHEHEINIYLIWQNEWLDLRAVKEEISCDYRGLIRLAWVILFRSVDGAAVTILTYLETLG
jgi:hypothetical protein